MVRSDLPWCMYVRISKAADGSTIGVERQEPICRQVAERIGVTIGHVYCDNDLSASAFSTKPRTDYAQMLEELQAGKWGGVVFVDTDRLTRRLTEVADFIERAQAFGFGAANSSGLIDLSSSDGTFRFGLDGLLGDQESRRKSERLKRYNEDFARKGRVRKGGRRGFGFHGGCCPTAACKMPAEHMEARARQRVYDETGVWEHCCPGGCAWFDIREDEAKLLREAVARLLAGMTRRSVAGWLNQQGSRTPRGAIWTPSNLTDTMRRPVIAGMVSHGGKIVRDGEGKPIRAEWEPIIDRETWFRLDAIVGQKSKRGPTNKYLLSGIARCGRCGSLLLHGKTNERKVPVYRCVKRVNGDSACGRLNIMRVKADQVIRDEVVQALSSPEFLDQLNQAEPDLAKVMAQVNADEARLEQLIHDNYSVRDRASESPAVQRAKDRAFEAAQTDLERRIEAGHAQLSNHGAAAVLGQIRQSGGIEEWWDSRETNAERRAVVQLLFKRIRVMPAAGRGLAFDPRRISLEWNA